MKKHKFIVYTLLLFIVFFGYFNGYTEASSIINFEDFINNIKLVEQSKREILIVKFFKDFNKIKNNPCEVDMFDDYVEVSSICLLDKSSLPNLPTDETLSFLLNDLGGFRNYYSLSENFYYSSTQPYFDSSKISGLIGDYDRYMPSIYKKIVITYLENNDKRVRIEKSILSRLTFDRYSFYVVPTELSTRSSCSLANYRAAVSHLDGLSLEPGQELNLNSLISYDSNSCRGTTSKSYMFYAGACGSSTQLFRLSLLMPYLDVVERHPHSKRWAFYYGGKIAGDDAAMYENSKKMIVKNNFNETIHFKVYEQGTKSYLLGILPDQVAERVEIKKTSKGLASSVTKNIYNGNNELINIYQFDSRYSSYNPYRN